jgi:hypothetical protein
VRRAQALIDRPTSSDAWKGPGANSWTAVNIENLP